MYKRQPYSKVFLQTTVWYFDIDKQFEHVDDEGLINFEENNIQAGINFNIAYTINNWLEINSDVSYAISQAGYSSHQDEFFVEGGITIAKLNNFSGGIGYRYFKPNISTSNLNYKSVFATDITMNYSWKNIIVGITIVNIFNTEYSEPEFATASRLTDNLIPESEFYFVPEDSVFIQTGITFSSVSYTHLTLPTTPYV